MNEIAKNYLEIGIIKELQEQGIISEEEMQLAIIEIKGKSKMEEDCFL